MGQVNFTDVGNIPGYFFRPELGVDDVGFVFLNMNRGQNVLPDETFGNDDSVFVTGPVKRGIGNDHILAQGQLAVLTGGTIDKEISAGDFLADCDGRLLVETGTLGRALELNKVISFQITF